VIHSNNTATKHQMHQREAQCVQHNEVFPASKPIISEYAIYMHSAFQMEYRQSLYSPQKEWTTPLDRRLDGPQSWSGYSGDGNNLCPCWESNPGSQVVQPVDWSLNWLSYLALHQISKWLLKYSSPVMQFIAKTDEKRTLVVTANRIKRRNDDGLNVE
jgi:hypothetical protein